MFSRITCRNTTSIYIYLARMCGLFSANKRQNGKTLFYTYHSEQKDHHIFRLHIIFFLTNIMEYERKHIIFVQIFRENPQRNVFSNNLPKILKNLKITNFSYHVKNLFYIYHSEH